MKNQCAMIHSYPRLRTSEAAHATRISDHVDDPECCGYREPGMLHDEQPGRP